MNADRTPTALRSLTAHLGQLAGLRVVHATVAGPDPAAPVSWRVLLAPDGSATGRRALERLAAAVADLRQVREDVALVVVTPRPGAPRPPGRRAAVPAWALEGADVDPEDVADLLERALAREVAA